MLRDDLLCCWCRWCCPQAYIENFLKEQEDAKAAARRAAQAEDQRIQDYWAMVAQRDAEEAARKAARKDAADRIYDQLWLEQEAALRAKVRQRDAITVCGSRSNILQKRLIGSNIRRVPQGQQSSGFCHLLAFVSQCSVLKLLAVGYLVCHGQ
jgi:Na+-translocating ferredoxin:NAD+ oxidoreductase RnfC subunit